MNIKFIFPLFILLKLSQATFIKKGIPSTVLILIIFTFVIGLSALSKSLVNSRLI